MRKQTAKYILPFLCLAFSACSSPYRVTNVQRTRILIDARYDKPLDNETADFMKPFIQAVDKLTKPTLGEAGQYLDVDRPESLLGNLLPDILMWGAKFYDEKPDFAVYNIGGMRSSIPKGVVTVGDIYDVAPFENKICFVTLLGEQVSELFQQIARRGGEGVSSEVRIVMDKDFKVIDMSVGGKPIDAGARYRVVTIDYVSHGNDNMVAFLKATDRRELTGDKDISRNIIMEYFKEKSAQGLKVESKLEGRIKIEQ